MERTLVLLKPDAIQRGLVGKIIARLEGRGLRIVGMKMIKMDRPLAEKHYAMHKGKPFFEGLVGFITSGPIVAMALEGRSAIDVVRNAMGATDSARALPGTIRGDLGLDIGHNLVHGSDSQESAKKELELFFAKGELISYARDIDPWITENKG